MSAKYYWALLGVLAIAISAALYTHKQNQIDASQQFAAKAELFKEQLKQNFTNLQLGLRGTRGLVISAGESNFNAAVFNDSLAGRDLAKEFLGVPSFAFIRRVPQHKETQFLAQAQQENPSFTIKQYQQYEGDRYLLQYISPSTIVVERYGLDLGSSPIERATLDLAAKTGQPTISPPLKQLTTRGATSPDVFMALAVYELQSTSNNAPIGWVAAPIFVTEMLHNTAYASDEFNLTIRDNEIVIYQQQAQPDKKNKFALFRTQDFAYKSYLRIGGRTWEIFAAPSKQFFTRLLQTNPLSIAALVFFIGTLLLLLTALISRRRIEQINANSSQAEQMGRLIDAAPCAMMFLGNDQKFKAVNKQFCSLTGYTQEELIASDFSIIAASAITVNNPIQQLTYQPTDEASSHLTSEILVRRKDGSNFSAEVEFSSITIANEAGAVATLVDISTRKEAAQKMERSEALFRSLANSLPQQVWTANKYGYLTYANQRCSDFHQKSSEAVMAMDFADALHPDDIEPTRKMWLNSIKTGSDYEIEFRLKRHDGNYVWHISRATVVRDSNSNVVIWYGTNTDISDKKRTEQALDQSAKNTQAIIDNVMDAIITIDVIGTIETFNNSASLMFGYSASEAVGKNVTLLMPEPHRSDHHKYLSRYLQSGEPRIIGRSAELQGLHKNGTLFNMELRIAENHRDDKKIFIGMVRDITERRYNEKLLATQDKILSLIARNVELPITLDTLLKDIEKMVPDTLASILILDESKTRLNHGAAPSLPPDYVAAINGMKIGPKAGSCGAAAYTQKPVIVTNIETDELWEDYRDLALKFGLKSCWSIPVFSGNNLLLGTFAIYFKTPRSPNTNHQRVISMATHVASLAITHHQRESQIRQLAFYDDLTGLPNRSLGLDRLNQAVADAHRRSDGLAVIFIDLDSFKTINDSLGHHVGDMLLKIIAERLESSIRENDTVARIGGDEFFIVLNGTAAGVAEVATQKILSAVSETIEIEGHSLYASCSIGVSLYPNDGNDANTLLRNADAAMYMAKESGRNNVKYYTEAMNHAAIERITLEHQIRQGLAADEFLLHYQPRINNTTGEIIGVEALVRWQHPTRGFLAPNHFIHVAELSGLIVPLGDWVIEEACQQMVRWIKSGCRPITVAVNLSARQFKDKRLVEKLLHIIEKTQLPNHLLELEITESMVMEEETDVVLQLSTLKAIGVQLAIDDFGTGYSNLSRLKHLPVDVLKIDKSFIDGIPNDKDDIAITSTIIAMAHHLKLKIIAEGVETEAQKRFLSDNFCDEMQGYLFNRPVAASEIEKMIKKRH